MFETFYNQTIRNTVIAFGSLFNEIYVVRRDNSGVETEKFKVPITYAPKEKFYRMLKEYSALKGTAGERDISTILPRIGFNIEAINYDSDRKRNTLSQRFTLPLTGLNKTIKYEYAEVPYNIEFNLSIASRTTDDILQITEQILAYFTPEFTISINYTDTHKRIDVPIIFTGIATEIDWEGDTSTQRSLFFNLTFTAKTYVYGPVKTGKIIRTVDTTFFNSDFINTGKYAGGNIGGVTGSTGALARVIASITGPTGSDSNPDDFKVSYFGTTGDRAKTIFETYQTLDNLGNTI